MPIYVSKNNQQSGPYDDHVVVEQLKNGTLSPNDLGIRQGDASWKSLGEMFPDASPARSSSSPASHASPVPAIGKVDMSPVDAAPATGGCLKTGMLVAGILLLLLGIGAGAGSRFIPSVSCGLAETDAREIEKLNSDLEKARKAGDTDEVRTLEFGLKQALSGARVSQENCDNDKLRNNIVAAVGGALAVIGFLIAGIGLIIGRRK